MAIKKIVEPAPIVDDNLDAEIENIKAFFNDPKSRAESDKLRHCIKYVLAEIASEDEEEQALEKARIDAEKGPTFLEFLFGKTDGK